MNSVAWTCAFLLGLGGPVGLIASLKLKEGLNSFLRDRDLDRQLLDYKLDSATISLKDYYLLLRTRVIDALPGDLRKLVWFTLVARIAGVMLLGILLIEIK